MSSKGHAFWQSGMDKKDGEEFSAFVMRLPHHKKCQDTGAQGERAVARHNVQKCLQWLLDNPTGASNMWGHIDAGLVTAPAKAGGDTSSPEKTVVPILDKEFAGKSVGKIHVDVKSTQLCAMPHGPSADLLEKIQDKDPFAVHDIYSMVFQYRSTDKVPDACKDPAELTLLNKKRHAEVGNRLQGWFDASVSEDGDVDWSAKPLFTPVFGPDGYLKSMVHVSGDVAEAPAGIWVTTEWKFLDPCSDDLARWHLNPQVEHKVYSWWGDKKGPMRRALDKKGKHLKDLHAQAAKEIADSKRAFLAIGDGPAGVSLQTRAKRLRDAALTQAREKQPRKDPRMLALPAASAPAPAAAEDEGPRPSPTP